MVRNSAILVVTLGSLHQLAGGEHEYHGQDAVTFRLPVESKRLLLETRAKAFAWLKKDKTAVWQGIPISEHEYNRNLVRGHDFDGNDKNALYYPALRRFEGRFFQTLGLGGKRTAYQSQHHVLLLCGLYGLSSIMEPIQRYNCPVDTNLKNFDIWTEDNTLTDILLDYIRANGITRVFDFTATEARRRLISWPAIHTELRGNVLHCFSTAVAGDDALIPFGKLMGEFLLGAPAETLLAIKPETEEKGIVFRSVARPRSGMPREAELREFGLADEIERKRRGVIRFLDRAENTLGNYEAIGNRVTRLMDERKISSYEANAMREITKWRNRIVYKEQTPDADQLHDIEMAWAYLARQVEKHKWKVDEFRKPNLKSVGL